MSPSFNSREGATRPVRRTLFSLGHNPQLGFGRAAAPAGMTRLCRLCNRTIAARLALLLVAAAACPATASAAAAGRVQAFSIAVNAAGQPLLTPTLATLSGRQVLYEIPVGPVRGTLAFFHGCAHNATASWPQQAACPACIGAHASVRMQRCGCSGAQAPLAAQLGCHTQACLLAQSAAQEASHADAERPLLPGSQPLLRCLPSHCALAQPLCARLSPQACPRRWPTPSRPWPGVMPSSPSMPPTPLAAGGCTPTGRQ